MKRIIILLPLFLVGCSELTKQEKIDFVKSNYNMTGDCNEEIIISIRQECKLNKIMWKLGIE